MIDKETFLKDMGRRLKIAREEKRMSQRELIELAGTAKGSVSSYEQGITEPGILSLARIAEVLEVSVAWLMYGKIEVDLGTDPVKAQQVREYIDFLNHKEKA